MQVISASRKHGHGARTKAIHRCSCAERRKLSKDRCAGLQQVRSTDFVIEKAACQPRNKSCRHRRSGSDDGRKCQKRRRHLSAALWQGKKASNPRPTVLERESNLFLLGLLKSLIFLCSMNKHMHFHFCCQSSLLRDNCFSYFFC